MGCCFSRPAGPNSPYPGGTATGSARAINVPPPASTGPPAAADDALSPTPSAPGPGHRQRHRQALAQHINKPLRRHEWASRSPTWTPRVIAREREEFFDTRVTGREEIWQALKAALEVLWDADSAGRIRPDQDPAKPAPASPGDDDGDVALATAQSILAAAEITLPTGDLANGVYDAFGNYYPLPEHIVSDPHNIALDGEAEGDSKGDLTGGEDSAEEHDLSDHGEVVRRREEKGKAVVDEQVLLTVRLSEPARDLRLYTGKEERVRTIVRKIHEQIGQRQEQRIRIAYLGKILKENAGLAEQGWKQGQVVNAFVQEHR